MGKALGVQERPGIGHYYEEKIALVEGLAAQAKDKPGLPGGSELLRTCTREMYQHDVITLRDNVADGIETAIGPMYPRTSLSWDPGTLWLYSDAQAQNWPRIKMVGTSGSTK